MKRRNSNLVWFCKVALMTALMIALHAANFAMIPTPWGASVTLDCLIVIVASLAIDKKAGWILSMVFGGLSAYGALTTSFVGVNAVVMIPIVKASALLIIAIALLSRICIPLGIQLAEKVVSKTKLSKTKQLMLIAIAGSLTNTVLYVGMTVVVRMLVGVGGDQFGILMGWAAGAVFFNGLSEAVLTAVVAPPIVSALRRIR